jgi:hypothetical protein
MAMLAGLKSSAATGRFQHGHGRVGDPQSGPSDDGRSVVSRVQGTGLGCSRSYAGRGVRTKIGICLVVFFWYSA